MHATTVELKLIASVHGSARYTERNSDVFKKERVCTVCRCGVTS